MKNVKSRLLRAPGILFTVSLLLALCAAPVSAAADPYPSKPVRLIISFPPGGSTDIVGRMIAAKLTERLGKQVIADNRGGAGGVLGTELAARSVPDGYTLLVIASAHVLNPALYKVPYDPITDFTSIAGLASGPNVLVVNPGVPANSVKELIALAKKQPAKLICAASGSGSFSHLASELFKAMAGIDIKIVQFKGGSPAMIDLMGGHSQIMLGSLIQVMPQIKAGKLKALGVGGKKRIAMLPGVPTIAEAGLTGYEASIWWGILAPAGMPKAIVDRLYKEIAVIVNSEDTKKMLATEGAEADLLDPAEFVKFLEAETAKWGKLIQEANIKGEQR